ncbi:phosphatidylserine decarboxylase [Streptomyces sp. NPDC051907]|uniref:phosphatidylserine decarboxylase n=1 Tax=Streptomyces sp. NPDC051907 TaxID=3155284 RepID=UPI00342770D8
MAQSIEEWVAAEVSDLSDKSPQWLAENHFFRDPRRPRYVDPRFFYSPADGIILYQRKVKPNEQLVDIKSVDYTLREALRDPDYQHESLVVGIFMTFFDVHTNRIPYGGYLKYRLLDPIATYNLPMIAMENAILDDLRIDLSTAAYLRQNQRMVSTVHSPRLGGNYHMLQIADYDVDCILPYRLKQNSAYRQGERFSQIRYGSQVELVVPLSDRYELEVLQPDGWHVKAGLDPLIRVHHKGTDGFK